MGVGRGTSEGSLVEAELWGQMRVGGWLGHRGFGGRKGLAGSLLPEEMRQVGWCDVVTVSGVEGGTMGIWTSVCPIYSEWTMRCSQSTKIASRDTTVYE